MLKKLKLKIKYYFIIVSEAIVIQCDEDYTYALAWLKKAKVLCSVCSVLGIMYGFAIGISGVLPVDVLSMPIGLFLGQWSFWGVATFILNIREILNIRKMIEMGKLGYNIGKEFKETYVNVTHEFGNKYKVTSHTENKGCLFAIIAIFMRFIFWMSFSVFVGAFLTVKKLIHTSHNIKDYQKNHN